MKLFPIIFILIFALILLYSKKRLLDKVFKKSVVINYILIFIFISIALYIFGRYLISIPIWLNYILSLNIGIGFILFTTTLFYELFLLSTKFIHISNTNKKIFELSLITLMLFYISYGIYNGSKEPTFVNVNLSTSKEITRDFTFVQISDLHIGGIVDREFVKKVVTRINSLNLDLVLITGDLVDTKIAYSSDSIEELKNLKSKFGTFYVLGNHEYFHNEQQIIDKLKSIGINTLINSNRYIEELNINIAGISDLFGLKAQRLEPSIEKASENLDFSKYTIFLSHQPSVIERDDFIEFDLTLSGHTHGGQIFPFGLLVLLKQPYLKGLHKIANESYLYINQGAGFWGPRIRIGTFSELTYFKVMKKT